MFKDANVQVETTWLESINNIDNEHTEFLSGITDKKIQSENGLMHIEDDDDKSDSNVNFFSDTFNEIDDDIGNCIVDKDTMHDDSYQTGTELQHDPYDVNTLIEIVVVSGADQMPLCIFRDEEAWTSYFQQLPVEKGDIPTMNIMLMFITVTFVNLNYIQLIEEQ